MFCEIIIRYLYILIPLKPWWWWSLIICYSFLASWGAITTHREASTSIENYASMRYHMCHMWRRRAGGSLSTISQLTSQVGVAYKKQWSSGLWNIVSTLVWEYTRELLAAIWRPYLYTTVKVVKQPKSRARDRIWLDGPLENRCSCFCAWQLFILWKNKRVNT